MPLWEPGVAADRVPAGAGGSEESAEPTLSGLAPRAGDSSPPADAASRRPVITLQVNFDLLRARASEGFFSASGKIWNHLDEEAVPAADSVMLQRNGIRVARGKSDAWPPIKALLEGEAIEVSNDQTAINNGLPLIVELDQFPHDQTLFIFRRDGTPAGASFPQSMNLLRIEYEVSLADPSVLRLRVMPELRLCHTSAELRFHRLTWREDRRAQPTRALHELAFEIEIGPDEFLVIGPSANTRMSHVSGSLLLREEVGGGTYESVYFITPRVYRTGGVGSP